MIWLEKLINKYRNEQKEVVPYFIIKDLKELVKKNEINAKLVGSVYRCTRCNSSLKYAELYCTGCGGKLYIF